MDELYKNVKETTKDSEIISLAEFNKILANHKKFLEAGGKGGIWQTFSVGTVSIIGVYTKCPISTDLQAILSYKNLKDIDLKNIDLTYANCAQIHAEKKDWSNANLEGALFIDSILNECIFKNANLNRVDFSRSDMINCDFQGASLKHADFERCNLTGANFKGAILDDGTSFKDAILEGAIFD